jgi:adenosylcobinamide hydrolase
MRYYPDSQTLFIRGSFRAASTGVSGGIRSVSALLIHTPRKDAAPDDPDKMLDRVTAAGGLELQYFGQMSGVPVTQACILQYDMVTVFITAGIRREPPAMAGSITITICCSEGLSDAALLEAIMVASEAKAEALLGMDLPLTGTAADAVITAGEGEEKHPAAGRTTDVGRRIREAVLYGLPEAVRRHDAGIVSDSPSFFIFSRLKEGHWIEWTKKDCPYFPCHFEGQSCDFCYCPFYPCRDETLGQWVKGSGGGRVWNCATCRLLHEPAIAGYLHKFPGASREELMRLATKP